MLSAIAIYFLASTCFSLFLSLNVSMMQDVVSFAAVFIEKQYYFAVAKLFY